MTMNTNLTGSRSRLALQVAAACTLAAALNLLVVPVCFDLGFYVPRPLLLPFDLLRLFVPFTALWWARRRSPIAKIDESRSARLTGSAGICMVAAGILWMTHDLHEIRWVFPGLLDLPWYGVLAANELARRGVHRGSRNLGLLALAALGVALGLVAALGSFVLHTRHLEDTILRWHCWAYTLVAEQPWIAMIWLAGLWSWVALVERRPAPREKPTPKDGASCAR
jgi:hypothetical protein